MTLQNQISRFIELHNEHADSILFIVNFYVQTDESITSKQNTINVNINYANDIVFVFKFYNMVYVIGIQQPISMGGSNVSTTFF
mgnify:CR=1 FL=1